MIEFRFAYVCAFGLLISNGILCTTTKTSNVAASVDLDPPDTREYTYEDKYVQFFENDPDWYHRWTLMEEAVREKGGAGLTKLCEEAHFRSGRGAVVIYSASMNASTLIFRNENYNPMKIDVVAYEIKDYGFYGDTDTSTNHFYITEGVRSDCVYYLIPANTTNGNEFYIDKPVCGLIIQ